MNKLMIAMMLNVYMPIHRNSTKIRSSVFFICHLCFLLLHLFFSLETILGIGLDHSKASIKQRLVDIECHGDVSTISNFLALKHLRYVFVPAAYLLVTGYFGPEESVLPS